MSQPPTSSIFTINTSPVRGATQYNGKIIIASLAMLFFVVLFILVLHIYVKWFWQRSLRRQQAAMWQRRQQGFPMEGDGPEAMTFGLDKAIVDSMPTFVYKVTDKEDLECAVCLSEFQENEKGRLLPKCSHRFHIDCIDMWFLSHSTCPLCRTSAEPSHPMVPTLQELELGVLSRSEGSVLRQQQEYGGHLEYPIDGAVPAASDHGGESLPSPGWRWRRSTSDGYTQNPRAGVQFPTNVLFWGNNSHVSSHASSTQVVAPPLLEHGQRGGLSLPHLAIDIPRRSVNIPRCSSSGAATQSYACASDQQQCKSPGTGLNVFKRLLSRERRVFPAEPDMGVCSSNSNSHAVGPSSAAASMGQ